MRLRWVALSLVNEPLSTPAMGLEKSVREYAHPCHPYVADQSLQTAREWLRLLPPMIEGVVAKRAGESVRHGGGATG